MRNPLKKISKKINFRLASNAAQHSSKGETPDGICSKKSGDSSQSVTELEHDDPLFNNRSSKLRLALAESKKNNTAAAAAAAARDSPKKKKKGSLRLSFGASSRKTNPNKDEGTTKPPAVIAESPTASSSSGSSKEKTAPRSPLRTERVAHKSATEISTPKRASFDAPTFASKQMVRDKAPISAYSKPSAAASATTTTTTKPPAAGMLDPNLERIARAAAALDNTGNELFERGEYDKAMASYVKALKLKNRTLAGTQQIDTLLGNPNLNRAVPYPPSLGEQETTTAPAATAYGASNAANETGTVPTQPGPNGADELWISVATSINNIGKVPFGERWARNEVFGTSDRCFATLSLLS
jgi:tetratricopeptide (TPR) repeat protein